MFVTWVAFGLIYVVGTSFLAAIVAIFVHCLSSLLTLKGVSRIIHRYAPNAMFGDYAGILGFQFRMFVLLPVFVSTLIGVICAAGIIGLIDGVG